MILDYDYLPLTIADEGQARMSAKKGTAPVDLE